MNLVGFALVTIEALEANSANWSGLGFLKYQNKGVWPTQKRDGIAGDVSDFE